MLDHRLMAKHVFRGVLLTIGLGLALGGCSDNVASDPDSAVSDGRVKDVGIDGNGPADHGTEDQVAVDGPEADQPANGIIYTDVSPDETVQGWSPYSIIFDPSIPNHGSFFRIWVHGALADVQLMAHHTDCHALVDSGGYPRALSKGDVIGPDAGLWKSAQANVNTNYLDLNKAGTAGNFIGVTDKHLGVRFKGQGGAWHYGWIRIDVDATPTQFVVKDYAYNASGGASLIAGEGQP